MPGKTPRARDRQLQPRLDEIFRASRPVAALSISETLLGRFEFLDSMGMRRPEDAADLTHSQLDEIYDATIDYALATLFALQVAKVSDRPPAVVYSDDDNVVDCFQRTALWAHHVCFPDMLFAAAINDRDVDHARRALARLLRLKPLIETAALVPVPQEVAEAISRPSILRATNADLRSPAISSWVSEQLLFEGPTARETMTATAKDDLQMWPFFRAYGRAGEVSDDGTITISPFGHYDPKWDYSSWVSQVHNEALSHYVQDVNTEAANADFLGGTYLTRSMFRARLLQRKGALDGVEQSLLWASVPLLDSDKPVELARIATNDTAVEDLRHRIAVVVRSCTSMSEMLPKIEYLKEDLDRESQLLDREISRSKAWTKISLGLSTATVAIGGIDFAWLLGASAAIATARTFVPYFEKRSNQKDKAAWIFHTLRKQ